MFAIIETNGIDYDTSSWEKVRQVENIVDAAIDDVLAAGFELQYILDHVKVRAKEKGIDLADTPIMG